MYPDQRPSAPDYTNAALIMFGVNMVWILILIWGVWGLIPALGVAWAVNRGISWIDQRRNG